MKRFFLDLDFVPFFLHDGVFFLFFLLGVFWEGLFLSFSFPRCFFFRCGAGRRNGLDGLDGGEYGIGIFALLSVRFNESP